MTKRFIVLEGVDGAGKTTLRKHLFRVARERGLELLNIIHLSWLSPQHAETITAVRFLRQERPVEQVLHAYVADKESLADTIIRPHLQYRHVLSDRYLVSDMVYSQLDAGIPWELLYEAYCSGRVLFPDLTVFVDTPPQITYDRMKAADGMPYITLAQQRERCEAFRAILLSDRFPQLGPVIRFENPGTKAEGLRDFERLMLPILLDDALPAL